MGDILAGVALIVIGLLMGESVFMGDFTILAIIFDGLGLFFIVKGLLKMRRRPAA